MGAEKKSKRETSGLPARRNAKNANSALGMISEVVHNTEIQKR